MQIWFLAAGALAALTCAIHVVLGGREVAAPLLASRELGSVPRLTQYYCWHLASVVLAGQAIAFFMVGFGAGSRDLAWFATAGAALFAAWNLLLILQFRLRPAHFPQWALFGPMAVLGACGLAA